MKSLWFSVALCVVALVLFTGALLVRTHDLRKLDQIAQSTNAALCTFKRDLERRYATAVEFLKDNPEGIPGIPAADLERSLASQRATLDALANLQCQ